MLIFIYDGTFEGLLTCIFEAYSSKRFPDDIQSEGKYPENLFAETTKIKSDSTKASRVWKGIQKKLSARNR